MSKDDTLTEGPTAPFLPGHLTTLHTVDPARSQALGDAVKSSHPAAQTEEILSRAAAFEAFLNGNPLPQPPSAKGVQAGILAEDGSFQQL